MLAPGDTLARDAAEFLEYEARALLTRLDRIRPFALQETMVPAAALSSAAQAGIERFLAVGRRSLRRDVLAFLEWIDASHSNARASEIQRRFTLLRLKFNDVISQFDLFSDVITQRSEHDTGVWLAGLDVLAQDLLTLPPFLHAQQVNVACYLDRGPGAAIRRARTRLPGGGENPVALVRVPRERMVGATGLGGSVGHEVGHQAASLLKLVPSAQAAVERMASAADRRLEQAWTTWHRWMAEILSDLWAVARGGVGATLGLMSVMSLPAAFVWRLALDDPHPAPALRVPLSAALGEAFYPHPQWRRLAETYRGLYPEVGLTSLNRRLFTNLESTLPALVELLVQHRPATLGGLSLLEATATPERQPGSLADEFAKWRLGGRLSAPPSLALAIIGQAKADGELDPRSEGGVMESLLRGWALGGVRTTLPVDGPLSHRPTLVPRFEASG